MERILCDSWFKNKMLYGNDPNAEINIRITAVNDMYGWLNQQNLLKSLSFVWREYDDGIAFGLDVKKLIPYREKMHNSGIKNAELAVQEIFDEEYSPCHFCGAIDLTWPMRIYRDGSGSWETGLVKSIPTRVADEVWLVLQQDGPIAAVEELFRVYPWKEEGCVSISANTGAAHKSFKKSTENSRQITVFVIERDNPEYRPEPEVVLDGKKALETVEREFEEQCKDLGIDIESGNDNAGAIEAGWNFLPEGCTGDAYVDDIPGGNRWEWRITEHLIPLSDMGGTAK